MDTRRRLDIAGFLAGHATLYFGLGFGAMFLEGVIEQPKAYYGPEVTWLGLLVRSSAIFGAAVALVAVVLILVNMFRLLDLQVPYDKLDRAYYPRFDRLSELRAHPPSVYSLVGVFLLLFSYWTWCLYVNIVERYYFHWHGWFWPPRVVLMTLLVAWGAVWLADILSRPTRQVLPVCCVYWVCVLLIWAPLGCSYVIE